jgi:Fe-S oxidoreductase
MALRGQRVRWAKKLDLASSAETMFFVGCSPSLLKQNLVENAVKIYDVMEEKIGYLGKEERCCSSPLLRVGEVNLFKEMAQANIDALKKTRAKEDSRHLRGLLQGLEGGLQGVVRGLRYRGRSHF